MRRKPMSLRLSEDEAAALKIAADEERVPAAVLVRSILVKWLAERSYTTRAAQK